MSSVLSAVPSRCSSPLGVLQKWSICYDFFCVNTKVLHLNTEKSWRKLYLKWNNSYNGFPIDKSAFQNVSHLHNKHVHDEVQNSNHQIGVQFKDLINLAGDNIELNLSVLYSVFDKWPDPYLSMKWTEEQKAKMAIKLLKFFSSSGTL